MLVWNCVLDSDHWVQKRREHARWCQNSRAAPPREVTSTQGQASPIARAERMNAVVQRPFFLHEERSRTK